MQLIDFHSPFFHKDDFLKNRKKDKSKLSLFLFINFGSLGTIFLSSIYYNTLRFQPWFSLGNGLIVWIVWLVVSLFFCSEKKFRTVILFSNNFFFVGLSIWLLCLTVADWFGYFFIFFLLFFFLENWLSTNFFLKSSLFLGFLSLVGMISPLFFLPAFLEGGSYFLMRFLLALIAIIMVTTMLIWNGLKNYNNLWQNNQMENDLKESAQVLQVRIIARTKQLKEQAESLKQENKTKTEALRERIEELERFRRLTVNRELKMVELKKEITNLKNNNS